MENRRQKQIAVLSLEKAAIALFLHIFARLPIFSGRHTDVFVEHGVEMANAAESQVIRDISDGSGAVANAVLAGGLGLHPKGPVPYQPGKH